AIAWSHDILGKEERRFFAAFSVFAGGADLDAVEVVLDSYAPDVLEALTSLVDKSLVRQDELPDGTPRFRMLETIRAFAQEQLAGRPGEHMALQRTHAEHFLARAEAGAARFFTDEQKAILDRVERDHDNLRAAFGWAMATGETVLAMGLVTASWRMWQMRGYLYEGEERARHVLDMPGLDEHPAELAAFLEAAGGLAYWQGNLPLAEERYERALAIQRRIGDEAAIANAIYNVTMSFGRDDVLPIAVSPERLANAKEALEIYRRIGDRPGEGRALWAMLDIEALQLHHDEAAKFGAEALRIFTEIDDRFMLGWTEFMLGLNEGLRGERTGGREHQHRALELFRAVGDLSAYALVIDGMASLAYTEGFPEYAMRLAGGADAIQRQGGAPRRRRIRTVPPGPVEGRRPARRPPE
ncbi:MAG: hypothetical protein LC804_11175, partial [Acidobacteria bacterium]|nr:hypothetical protein [Acidobacteriota bacterium]